MLRLRRENKILDNKINPGNGTQTDIENLAILNNQLIEIRRHKLKGAYIRSRADWLEYGEKPSKFFLNLENKIFTELKLDENTTITSQDQILLRITQFYKDLYSEKESQTDEKYRDIIPEQLTQGEKDRLEEPITKRELDKALNQMKNNKSPGVDGYSTQFLKVFWPQLGTFFPNYINYSYNKGILTDSLTQGLITCLPKPGKPRNLIKNWRPISLLNTTYKLLSLCITNRLREILCRVISREQKGFLKGRTISDCTRLMYDLIYSYLSTNTDGLILLIDFEKAFDSLSWKFIHETLENFNFGKNFIKWIKLFQNNTKSRIILNGHLSESFTLERGCPQGDPISPYFVLRNSCSSFQTEQ